MFDDDVDDVDDDDDDDDDEVRELVTIVCHKGLNRRRRQSLGRRNVVKHGRMISKTGEMENFK